MACLVTSSRPVPLKIRRVGQRCTLNLLRVETFARWTFQVNINSICSRIGSVQAGSPQGSIFSPFLYNLYTHDFPTTPTVEVCLFADDAAILTQARTPETVRKNLQSYLVKLKKWLTLWRISVNTSKTQAIIFKKGNFNNRLNPLKLFRSSIPWSGQIYIPVLQQQGNIKVVIKGYPKTADPDHIKSDLEKEGFLPERVTQLIGRRTKQKLPVFQVTLPRSMENLKIFDLKTLAHLNITVDGYNGKGITQCFSCNNFHHSAENCFLKPRCLKCGEEHLTKDCPIKQRLETKYSINCQVYGHMANWYGCPCFPKPKKGAAKINRNSYTNLYNSFVRPNFSYAQVAKNSDNTKTNSNSQNKPQMAPRKPETSNQTEASINVPPLLNQVQNSNQAFNSNPTPNLNLNTTQNGNNSDIKALLSTTVQCLIQLLNAMNTAPTIANSLNQVNSAQADANLMYGLIEASCNTNNDKPSHNINIANYTCYRNDRQPTTENDRAFGGTLILVKRAINHYSLSTPPLQTIEATVVILTPLDHEPISIVSIYIPPKSDEFTFTIDIENLIQTSSNCVLFGDFNAPHTAWNCKNNSSRGVRLLDYSNLTNLHIAYPDSPTRFGINTSNTLDIALIRNFYYPYSINSLHDLSSDHNPVLQNFTLKLNKEISNPRAVHTNWPLFSKNLNANLSLLNYHPNTINTHSDIDQKITEFTYTVRSAHSHASRPIVTAHKSYTPPHIHKLIKQKNQYRNLYHRTLDPHYKTLYNKAQKNVKKELRNYSNENWTARLQALNAQGNSLWAVQKFLKNKRSDIPPLNCATGTAVTDNQKANILADSIIDNFTENIRKSNKFDEDDELINNTVTSFLSNPPLTTTEIAYPSEIISYIKKSNSKKAPGKDGISNRMTKNFSLKAILILTILINKILTLNYFPKSWKEAIIFPILKPGKNKNLPASYRPISLLSTLSKITESIILTRLKNFIYTNNLLNPNQYGFTNKLSTLHPLLNLTEAISEGFQNKKSTGAVFLDIQKAFDRVWLTGLTYKLINYNLPPPLVFLLHSYNTNRSYQVRVKEVLSNTKNISCGVAQGSLLGPLLFNLYINDIPDYSLTKINMFADDTAIHTTYRRISSVTFALNKHLKLLENYYDKWKISINVDKSAAVLFTKKRKIPPPPTMYNTTIPWSQSTKYLGITFDKNLTWKNHIQLTRQKFRKIMFKLFPLIGRNSELTRNNKVLLYTAVMRPIIAYGCPVWDTLLKLI
ncbi:probable RNA-directed DNA polymerase from transposon X-element [Trichonephila clavipes]|nr:probable RNA-directed DNA polymerase from transposon X-element [Trichonephila clavipes]